MLASTENIDFSHEEIYFTKIALNEKEINVNLKNMVGKT